MWSSTHRVWLGSKAQRHLIAFAAADSGVLVETGVLHLDQPDGSPAGGSSPTVNPASASATPSTTWRGPHAQSSSNTSVADSSWAVTGTGGFLYARFILAVGGHRLAFEPEVPADLRPLLGLWRFRICRSKGGRIYLQPFEHAHSLSRLGARAGSDGRNLKRSSNMTTGRDILWVSVVRSDTSARLGSARLGAGSGARDVARGREKGADIHAAAVSNLVVGQRKCSAWSEPSRGLNPPRIRRDISNDCKLCDPGMSSGLFRVSLPGPSQGGRRKRA